MNSKQLFSLDAWIETHDMPIVVINKTLRITAINAIAEQFFGLNRSDLINKPCCQSHGKCRHGVIFEKLESYAGYFTDEYSAKFDKKQYWIKGNVIQNAGGINYVVETYNVSEFLESKLKKQTMVGISPVFLKRVGWGKRE